MFTFTGGLHPVKTNWLTCKSKNSIEGTKKLCGKYLLWLWPTYQNEGPNQCFMGKNVRYRNSVCLIDAEIFPYPQNPRFPMVHHMRAGIYQHLLMKEVGNQEPLVQFFHAPLSILSTSLCKNSNGLPIDKYREVQRLLFIVVLLHWQMSNLQHLQSIQFRETVMTQ